MMREEFIREVKKLNGDVEFNISPVDYSIIETVYMYHPSISEVNGKQQIAYLYFHYGMRVIKDMLETAVKCEEIQKEIHKKKTELKELENKYNKIIN